MSVRAAVFSVGYAVMTMAIFLVGSGGLPSAAGFAGWAVSSLLFAAILAFADRRVRAEVRRAPAAARAELRYRPLLDSGALLPEGDGAWRRHDEWRAAWRTLPRARRRAIWRAVLRGQAMTDPGEALLAAGTAIDFQRRTGLVRRIWWPLAGLWNVLLVMTLVTDSEPWWGLGLCAFNLAVTMVNAVRWPRQLRRAQQAERRNREVADEAAVPPAPE